MPRDSRKNRQKTFVLIAIVLVACVVALAIFTSRETPDNDQAVSESAPPPALAPQGEASAPEKDTADSGGVVTGDITPPSAIDYKDLEKDDGLKAMMDDRKKNLGIKKSLDMIVKSDESFTVGESTVSMQKILEKAFTSEGKVFEEELSESGSARPSAVREYGIYVVQPGDNLWNIHFRILKDYYAAKSIRVEEKADEPGNTGMSSGVGKILKFSETMVVIYNLLEEKVAQDINIIEPLSKVVVYNMTAVFNLLEEINFDNVNRLQFDGKNIWIPAKES
ncbi:MAG: hypothetical protein V6Z89_15445 [Desulfobacter sp.]